MVKLMICQSLNIHLLDDTLVRYHKWLFGPHKTHFIFSVLSTKVLSPSFRHPPLFYDTFALIKEHLSFIMRFLRLPFFKNFIALV